MPILRIMELKMKKNKYFILIILVLVVVLIILILLILFKKNAILNEEIRMECESTNIMYVDDCETLKTILLKVKNGNVLSSQTITKYKCDEESKYNALKEKFYMFDNFTYDDEKLIISHPYDEEKVYSAEEVIPFEEYKNNALQNGYICNDY